jgi:hypothetical protein
MPYLPFKKRIAWLPPKLKKVMVLLKRSKIRRVKNAIYLFYNVNWNA